MTDDPGDRGSSGRLTHLDADGRPRMVDVSAKPITDRVAVATGQVLLSAAAAEAVALRAVRLRAVFDQCELLPVLRLVADGAERRHVGHLAVQVHGQDRGGLGIDRALRQRRIVVFGLHRSPIRLISSGPNSTPRAWLHTAPAATFTPTRWYRPPFLNGTRPEACSEA